MTTEVVLDDNREVVLTNATVTASGSVVVTSYGGKEVILVINVSGTVTGTTPTLTFTIQELDPGDEATSIGVSVSGAAITATGTQIIEVPVSRSSFFKVSWTIGGTATPTFNGVYATLINKGAGASVLYDNLGNSVFGTAGSPGSAVLTVQGVSGGQPSPVSGTVTSNQGTPNTAANSWPVEMTDGTNVLGTSSHPVRVDPTGTTTQPVSGTVTAQQATAANLNATVVQGAGSGAAATYWYVRVTDGTHTMPTMDAIARAGFQEITDGTNGPVAVKAASTAAAAADPSLVTAFSPNSPLPTGSNVIGAVTQSAGPWSVSGTVTANQGTANTQANAWPTEITDGTHGPVAVKAASTAAAAADPSLVVALSPNSPVPAGTNIIGALSANQSVNVAQVGGSATSTAATGVQKVGVVGNAGATMDATLAAGAAPTNGLGTLAQYNTTQPAPTNAQTLSLQSDQSGNLLTFPGVETKTGAAWTSGTSVNTLQYPTGTTTVGAPLGGEAVLVQLDQTTTLTGGAVTFQGSYDGINWVTIPTAQVLNPQTFAQLTNPYSFVASTNQPFLILLQGFQQIRLELSTVITGTGSVTPYWTLLVATGFSAVAQGAPNTLANAWPTEITDGTHGPVAVKAASTAVAAGDASLAVGLSPNSPLPAGTNAIGSVTATQATAANLNATVVQGAGSGAAGTYWYVRVTDGTNTMPTMDTAGRAGFQHITDGTNTAAVKAASTAAAAADPSLVIAFSPNSPLPTGSNVIGAVTQSAGPWSVSGTVTANQGTANTVANSWPTEITDGTHGPAAVKAASTAVAATDPSLAVGLSPNSPLPAGTNVIGALTANQSVNLAQVGGTSTVTGGEAGALGVGGLAAAGSAPVGNPVLVAGSDGVDARTLLTDTSGRQEIVGAAAAGAAAAGNPVQVGSVFQNTSPAPATGNVEPLQSDQAGNLLTFPGIEFITGAAWTSGTAINTLQYQTGTTTIGQLLGASAVLVQLDQTTTLTGGAVTVQGTFDGINWVTVPAAQVLNPNTFAQIANPYTFVASTNQPILVLLQGYIAIRLNLTTVITGTGSVTPYWSTRSIAPQIVVAGAGTAGTPEGGVVTVQGVSGGTTLPVTAAQGAPNTVANSWPTEITDGTHGPVAVKAASTAAAAADPSLVTAFSPNSPLPAGTNTIGVVNQGTAASVANSWTTEITDGTHGPAAVKAASTAAAAADPSLVVALSPNTPTPGVADITATGALGALNAAVTITTAGTQGVGFQLASGTLIGTIVAEVSYDGGTTWNSAYFDQNNKVASIVFGSANTAQAGSLLGEAGAGEYRVRVSAFTSGTANITLRASEISDPTVLFAGVPAAAVQPPTAAQVAGWDGSNLRVITTDSSGRQQVIGGAASGSAVAGNPVLVAGSDGANARSILTDTSGRQEMVGAAAVGAAPAGNPLLLGVVAPSGNMENVVGGSDGEVGVAIMGNDSSVHSNSTITTSGSTTITKSFYGVQQLNLIVNVTAAPTGTTPTITYTIQELDPGNGTTTMGNSASTSSITGTGVFTASLPTTTSSAIKVSWTVTGTTPSFTGVYATVVSKATPSTQTTTTTSTAATPGISPGYITTSAKTNVALSASTYNEQSANFTGSVVSGSANDSSAGTGARTITITWMNSTGSTTGTESATMNGTTAVNLVTTTKCFIEKIVVATVGSTGSNVGAITLFSAATGGGTAVALINATDNQTYLGHHYVVSGKTCHVTDMTGETNSSNQATFTLQAINIPVANQPSLQVSDWIVGSQTFQIQRTYSSQVLVAGPARIQMFVAPGATASITSQGSFDYFDQ